MKNICRSLRSLLIFVLAGSMILALLSCGTPAGSNSTNNSTPAAPAPTYADTNIKLSELTDDKLLDYLVELGLEIPEGCDVPEDNVRMARHYVEQLEADPNWEHVSNFIWTEMLFLRTKIVVSKYYGQDDIAEKTQELLDAITNHSGDVEEKDLQ